jgi:hypothetical protein
VEQTQGNISTGYVRLRTYIAILAVILPILLGLGLIYLFTAGAIGIATTLAGSFALVAFAVTAVVFHFDADESDADGMSDSRLHM